MSQESPSPAPPTPAALRPIESLDAAECHDVLSKHRLCVLAMVDGEEPYAVPVYYGFDGETMYLGVAEGRKTEVLDRNPRVCVTVSEPGAWDSWRSVLVAGVARSITEPDERARAIDVMMKHNRRPDRVAEAPTNTSPSTTTSAAPPRHGRGRMLVVERATITGRARRPPDPAPDSAAS
jgi:nitroimidazol reductase NimA-like FMN-containing flavoprotein (pyridoxamine 5'-phosphate oxidase superfamily)